MEIPANNGIRPEFQIFKVFSAKLTLPFMVLSTINALVYIFELTSNIDANFVKISEYQVWRVATAIFGSSTPYHLLLNLLWLKMLSNLSERRRGSFPFILDVIFKGLLINSFSVVTYVIISSCAKRFGSQFDIALYVQQEYIYSGYSALLVSEIFFLVLTARLSLDDQRSKEEMRSLVKLKIVLLLILIINVPFSQSITAILLALLNRRGLFTCVERFKVSQLNFNIEQALKRYERLFYFYFVRSIEEREYYDSREKIKMSKGDEDTGIEDSIDNYDSNDLENGTGQNVKEEEEEDAESEVNKSRYEEVDVNDYILERSKNKNQKEKEPDSYEI